MGGTTTTTTTTVHLSAPTTHQHCFSATMAQPASRTEGGSMPDVVCWSQILADMAPPHARAHFETGRILAALNRHEEA